MWRRGEQEEMRDEGTEELLQISKLMFLQQSGRGERSQEHPMQVQKHIATSPFAQMQIILRTFQSTSQIK